MVTPDILKEFNLHIPEYPRAPHLELKDELRYGRDRHAPVRIDYDRIGRAVAKHARIPEMQEVSQLNVSMDE